MKKNLVLLALLVSFTFGCGQEDDFSRQPLVENPAVDPFVEQVMPFTIGSYQAMKWKPTIYPADGVVYDLFYYIPETLRNEKNYPMMIFLHGGGGSTVTREGSINAINKYKERLISMANALNVAVILPSGSGMNWGTHTGFYMRSLIKMLRNSLSVDPDRIGIAGHSMGGMAMTRNSFEVTDQVAFVMPMAAGLDKPWAGEENLRTEFNTPYYHVQGLNDAFTVFIERCNTQAKLIADLELKYNQKSKFTMEFTQDDHGGVLDKLTDRARTLFATKRDLYQPKLFGQLVNFPYKSIVDVGQKIQTFARNRYFWLEATEYKVDAPIKVSAFIAEVKNNTYQIDFDDVNDTPTKMRIYLSSKMVDFTKKIEVYVNKKLVFTRQPSAAPSASTGNTIADQAHDQGFQFEDTIELTLPLMNEVEVLNGILAFQN